MTTYEARPTGCVTVCRSPEIDEGDLRKYLERLLGGLVSGDAIVIAAPPSTADASNDTSAARLPIVYQPSARPGRASHLDWLATAGAVLVCATVVLNVGPFGSPRKAPAEHAIAFVSEPDDRTPAQLARAEPAARQDLAGATQEPESSARDLALLDQFAFPERRDTDADLTRTVADAHTVAVPVTTAALWSSSLPTHAPAAPWPTGQGEAAQPTGQPVQSLPENLADQGEDPAAPASTIVGVWAPDAGTCSAHQFRDGTLPTVITTDGAWAGDTFCLFSKQQQTDDGLRVVAKCSNPRERWTSQVRLTVKDQRLTWSSKRGVQAYARCTPDLLMAKR